MQWPHLSLPPTWQQDRGDLGKGLPGPHDARH